MQLTFLLWLACLVSVSLASPSYGSEDSQQAGARREFRRLETKYQQNIQASLRGYGRKCDSKSITRRQEWGSLSKNQRLDYISAVKCLQRKPPRSSKKDVPGARSRYDDFTAVHLQQTPYIHFSGLFLPFHRYFVWAWEQALRQECGYKGYQPYWDWTISYGHPEKMTVFDGSPYSLGGNGKAVPHGPTTVTAFGLTLQIPPGTGGGCVTSGPFSSPQNYNLSLGPVAIPPAGPDGGLGSNPRCFTRDLNGVWTRNFTKPTDVLSLVQSCTDIACWDGILESQNGVHGAGHFTVGGDGNDPYTSTNDPVFWLHHANVDRVWSIWQGQNLRNRTNQYWGTQTAFNNPPSAFVTPGTLIDFGVIAPKQTLGSIGSTVDGAFCYLYV